MFLKKQLFWLLVCCYATSLFAADEVRTWTDTKGRKMQAQFVREVDGDVTFIKDGKLITLPLDQLSAEDQKFIQTAEANKQIEEKPRPAGAPRPIDESPQIAESPPAGEAKSGLTKKRLTIEERTWRDVRGKAQVGKFVRIYQGVVIISSGSRAIRVPYYTLSQPDREYIRELLTARGELAQLPPELPHESAVAAAQPSPMPPSGDSSNPAAGVSAHGSGTPIPDGGEKLPATRENVAEGNAAGAPEAIPSEPVDRLAMRTVEVPNTGQATTTKRNRQPLTPAAVVIALVITGISVMIGSAVGAVILRAAVSLYNVMAGGVNSDSSVPEPAFGEAFGITFITWLVNGVVGFLLGVVIGIAGLAANWSEQETRIAAHFVSFPMSLGVMAMMLSSMLPTTLGRAILITLCYLVVSIFVFGIIIVVGVVVWGMATGGGS